MLDKNLQEQFNKIDEICYENSKNILEAFRKNQLSEVHFNSTTGMDIMI
jgi:cystathionine beta-lyase family protein involved in aluminum resistance